MLKVATTTTKTIISPQYSKHHNIVLLIFVNPTPTHVRRTLSPPRLSVGPWSPSSLVAILSTSILNISWKKSLTCRKNWILKDKKLMKQTECQLIIGFSTQLSMWPPVVKWNREVASDKGLILHLVQNQHCVQGIYGHNHLDQYFQFVKVMLL